MWDTWIKQLVSNYTSKLMKHLKHEVLLTPSSRWAKNWLCQVRWQSLLSTIWTSCRYLCSWWSLWWWSELLLRLPKLSGRHAQLSIVWYMISCTEKAQYWLLGSYYWITQAFQSTSGSISNLYNGINTLKSSCKDTTLLGSFMENHDVARFASLNSDYALAKNAIGFTMLADGIPIIYQGQEQHFSGSSVPNNREALWLSGYSTSSQLYSFIATINMIRKQAIKQDTGHLTYKAYPVYSDASTIVMRKGTTGSQVIGVFTNKGSSGSSSFTLSSTASGFTAGQSVTDALSCTSYTADSNGNIAISINPGAPRVLYPTSKLTGSGLCGGSSPTSGTPTTIRTSTVTGGCNTITAVAVTFSDKVTTQYGQTIKLAGSIPQLGSWNAANAVTLSSAGYTASNTVW